MTPPNSYSEHWFRHFHADIPQERTAKEIELICSVAPLPEFRRVLDVCCGMGRHARALVQCGYSVTGIERDAGAIAKAREPGDGPEYVQADVREYQPATSAYDVAIVMSQSFGYFDAATNRELLRRLSDGLRGGGRIILDLWNPEFFITHRGERNLETPAGIVRERKEVRDGRLFVRVDYPEDEHDDFEWQLFTSSEMHTLADSVGLSLIVACTDFEGATKPRPDKSRTQFVLEQSPRVECC